MIDHVSLGVKDLERSTRFYERVLATLGHRKLMSRPSTVGFGKKYPEFWLNHRPQLVGGEDNGTHVCWRTPRQADVEAFYACALENGARCDGAPGLRPEYHPTYFAAFVRDLDGHRIEVVTFLASETGT